MRNRCVDRNRADNMNTAESCYIPVVSTLSRCFGLAIVKNDINSPVGSGESTDDAGETISPCLLSSDS
jgi:hypothetical protein